MKITYGKSRKTFLTKFVNNATNSATDIGDIKTQQKKYLCIAYSNTGNIGDAIQSVALSTMIDGDISGVLRQEIGKADKSKTFVINGYMAENCGSLKESCNFSLPEVDNETNNNVYFLGVHAGQAQHFNNYCQYKKIIGARDTFTLEELKNRGVKSECIGCASIMFDRYNGDRSGIYSVNCEKKGKIMTHGIPFDMSWENQWEIAIKYLDIYRTAKEIYTSKLHVLLPCLAFGTPVYFAGNFDDRFTILDYYSINKKNGWMSFDNIDVYRKRFLNFSKEIGLNLTINLKPQFPKI